MTKIISLYMNTVEIRSAVWTDLIDVFFYHFFAEKSKTTICGATEEIQSEWGGKISNWPGKLWRLVTNELLDKLVCYKELV